MTIGIGFGPEFATKIEFIETGVRQVTAGMHLPTGCAEALLQAFIPPHRDGCPRTALKAVSSVLRGQAWTWVWMLNAAECLRQIGVWPWWWAKNGFNPEGRWQDVPEHTRLDLLSQALWAACFVARDEAKIATGMRILGCGTTLMTGRKECPAEAYFVATYRGAIENGDRSVRPPFFPLDTTRLQLDLARSKMRS